MKKLYVIHHSHTDIGYTENQYRIKKWHVDFIRQALDIIKKDERPFIWNCETFWAVEQFLSVASQPEKEQFIDAVSKHRIGLSASYLNFNELIGYSLLNTLIKRATDFGKSINVPIDSAMTADINGYSWGFSQSLFDHDVHNLFSCTHSHHGHPPLKRNLPFWWETPKGNKILVWNGEHYHFGNELGIVPKANSSYIIKDECNAETIFTNHWKVMQTRIPRLFEQLDKNKYPYDFYPVMASGLRTDNAPPNQDILKAIDKWNEVNGDNIQVEMITLSDFFAVLRQQTSEIETYSGDWPDWWSDGMSGYPKETKIFRQAQRDYEYYLTLNKNNDADDLKDIEENLALYAEHTFGHADSVSRPWLFMEQTIATEKKAYASRAYQSINEKLSDSFKKLGAVHLRPHIPLRFKLINRFDNSLDGYVQLPISHYEFHELKLDKGAEIIDVETLEQIKYQVENIPGGASFTLYDRLKPNFEKIVEIKPTCSGLSLPSTDGTCEVKSLETKYLKIEWEKEKGITSWFDKLNNRELIQNNNGHNPFTPVHDITSAETLEQICAVRGKMGLNRKGQNVKQSFGKLKSIKNFEKGDMFKRITLEYDIQGCEFYAVILTLSQIEPRVDVAVRIAKNNHWEPENLYLSLPFSTKDKEQLYFDKTGAITRPNIDQLPNSLTDFYSIQDGLVVCSDSYGVAIATPDSNLIQLGSLHHGDRTLHDPNNLKEKNNYMYAWLMTNYWETNFSAGLGGFYEFRYTVMWGDNLSNPYRALRQCRLKNQGIRSFRVGE